eukprot:16447222-Heterocapsa_arctica.AAC.2
MFSERVLRAALLPLFSGGLNLVVPGGVRFGSGGSPSKYAVWSRSRAVLLFVQLRLKTAELTEGQLLPRNKATM